MSEVFQVNLGGLIVKIEFSNDSFVRHNIRVEEVFEALAVVVDDHPQPNSRRGNPREIQIGYTQSGVLLEIGIEYLAIDHFNIYHVDDCRQHYKDQL
jgi:hypothetical protein